MSKHKPPLPANIRRNDAVVLFDGVCNFCNGVVQFLIRRDKDARLRLASLQSEPGQALLKWQGRPLDEFDTMMFVEGGRAYFKSTAALRIARYFRWPWPALSLALVIPQRLRDWCYDRLARNRYRWFGRQETCWLPTPDLKRRFLA
jgi:predicted DCC family thiol-disulfide oxidoreductase YuxK